MIERDSNVSLYQQIHTIGGPMIVNEQHIKKAAESLGRQLFNGRYGLGNIWIGHGILHVHIHTSPDRIPAYIPFEEIDSWESYPVEYHYGVPSIPQQTIEIPTYHH